MLKTREEIKDWLYEYRIFHHTINDDLSVDVDGYVYLSHYDLTEISVQFNKVNGWFGCSHNQLTSLIGSPKIVLGEFYCLNNQLTSLKYLPKIHGKLYCDDYLHETREYKIYSISKKLKELV